MPPLARALPLSVTMNSSSNTISRLAISTQRGRSPRALSSSASQRSTSSAAAAAGDHDAHDAHAHESHFDPPSGWLWGVKPGEKYEKEGWEGIWYWGFFGSLGLGVVGYAFKPDTSIQTWALEEARRRLEVEGILKEPDSK